MMLRRAAAASLTALSIVAGLTGTRPAHAQARTIEWPVVAVEARLDADGRLHVRERLIMRFTGEWNGGERRFDVRPGQRFEFTSASRLEGGAVIAMHHGDLDRIDGFDFVNGSTLRWRARQPSDAPFDRTEREYLFEYGYERFLEPPRDAGRTYVLAHDFAFADRENEIERFTLSLSIDDAWRTPPGFTGRFEREHLPPDEGFVVRLELDRVAAMRPAALDFGADARTRYGLALLALIPILPLVVRLVRREHSLGRFVPPPPPDAVNEAWLAQHVLALPPEVVGHAWDDRTSESEVAATLARLVQQGKLTSTVHKRGRGLFARDVLELRLNTPRSQLTGHARLLIDALFVAGDVTDTDKVRKHYKSTGFDPASLIREPIAALVDATPGTGNRVPRPSRLPTLLLFLAGLATLLVGLVQRPQDAIVAVPGIGALLVGYIIALVAAALWQRRVRALVLGALPWVVPQVAVLGALGWLLITAPRPVGAFALAGLTLVALALFNSVLNMAMTRQSAERIAMRKRLVAAREFFRRELRREQPALRDDWFAYLIAFGLGRHIDRWFRAFGDDVVRSTSGLAASRSTSSAASSSGSSWTGFGGGGGFAGGGSSASFAAAIGGMASSVSAPSSSGSSGGGGGGGGSSGGGGGGGW